MIVHSKASDLLKNGSKIVPTGSESLKIISNKFRLFMFPKIIKFIFQSHLANE
jgi:hypothetical protein